MSVTYRGERFVSIAEIEYTGNNGSELRYREKGIPEDINSRAASYQSQGYNLATNQRGPYKELIATRVSNVFGEGFIERWTIAAELLFKSIWSLPIVAAEAASFASGGKSRYRQEIEKAVSQGTALPVIFNGYPVAPFLLQELRRGNEGYETEHTVIKRDINFDFDIPPFTMQLTSTRLIFTTAQLIANEAPPPEILFALPTDPAPGYDVHPIFGPLSLWGWRARDQSAEITNASTGSHHTTWVYAQWSTLFYTPA